MDSAIPEAKKLIDELDLGGLMRSTLGTGMRVDSRFRTLPIRKPKSFLGPRAGARMSVDSMSWTLPIGKPKSFPA
ncbi:hypothetical protein ACLB2K_067557 [Fragaria x ananassa]